MITEIRKVPVTEETRPFATALKVCPLEELGYAEEEYFQSGTANAVSYTHLHMTMRKWCRSKRNSNMLSII